MAQNKYKHLTPEERREIEECLEKKMSFKAIARLISKDPTTVSYEIKHHRQELRNRFVKTTDPCPQLLKAPFVCNGCQKRHSSACPYIRFLYRGPKADQEYRELLSSAREGIPLNKEEFYENDRIITEGLKSGRHLYQIMSAAPEIHCSKSTVYRHFHKGYYSAALIDLPRAVKFKKRRQKRQSYVPKGLRIGRSHDDFLAYMEEHPSSPYTQLDTVIGRVGGKVILTILFPSCSFMAGLLLDGKLASDAASAFSALKNRLRTSGISLPDFFGVFLTDNGGEFSDVFAFENDPYGVVETPMFFCDPQSPSQKPQIEKNHTHFRDIVPKGASFDDFTQETVNLIFSHVNSVNRPMYAGKSPFDMFTHIYSERAATLLGISRVPPFEVIQSPSGVSI